LKRPGWYIDPDYWAKRYGEIRSLLPLNFTDDQVAADLLSNILQSYTTPADLDLLRFRVSSRALAVIVGAGPSIERDLEVIERAALLKSLPVFAADGASSYLLEVGLVPTAIVTDLDGRLEDIAELGRRGSYVFVHAHGDNINTLYKAPLLGLNIVGTTQVEPRPYVYNFGGFTDGDRAAYIAHALGARILILCGMNMRGPIGKYSTIGRPKKAEVKMLKLKIAAELLRDLIALGVSMYSPSDTGVEEVKPLGRIMEL